MNTLIELYDERAIENILAPDMFRPRRIVYLCPDEIAQDRTRQETLAAFFRRRGWEPELIFVETSLFKADRILRQLFTIGERFPDCAIDITGGSDAALFAAGMPSTASGAAPAPRPPGSATMWAFPLSWHWQPWTSGCGRRASAIRCP